LKDANGICILALKNGWIKSDNDSWEECQCYIYDLLGSKKEWSHHIWPRLMGRNVPLPLYSIVDMCRREGLCLHSIFCKRLYQFCPRQLMQWKEVVCRHTQSQQQGKLCLEGRGKCSIPSSRKPRHSNHTELCRFQRKVLSSGT